MARWLSTAVVSSMVVAVLALPAASSLAATSSTGGTAYGWPAPTTLGSLPAAVSPTLLAPLPLHRGAKGPQVLRLQQWLGDLGYRIKTIGKFETRTERAVRTFQRQVKIPPTGVVDAPTAQQIARAVAASGATQSWVFPIYPLNVVAPMSTWSLDQGVDISTLHGECGPKAVEVAVAPGTIVKEGIDGFGSQAPVLQLDSVVGPGRYVYYGHAQPALVPVGTHVNAGDPVAELGCGHVGRSSTPHLEIGISEPGGGPCCPSWGATSHEMRSLMGQAYRSAAQVAAAHRGARHT